ncbi:DNA repair and recombination protein RAD54B isoform X1 [Hyla sarda]|uniref:DNA repair and recombination protein RAD54B isoform X1 n=1 Tax=Hyla sarda TaxID=327740 RepID=UPI0024C33EA4|nr:DNA repair and recombination protein RAD54B isoform X1 [Hyla sarda]XP_056378479.1 DNA repair and recombination protein RAD54B isoform X1 [Hyla sarda]XP_056378480.1 DNA repair and recombination protein RAD54B isoform X1 [Hyla sarda]
MRRSAAPSQQLAGNAAKRPRFVPPVKVNTHVAVGNVTATLKPKNDNVSSEAFERSCRGDLISPGEVEAAKPVATTQKSVVAAVSRFRPPTGFTAPPQVANQVTDGRSEENEPGCPTKYFSVVWCKASKKKHKKWEGDAVLVTRGRSVTLKDMEGKDIGKGSGYKLKDLEGLEDGHTLMIGGKEIEVMGTISAEDYTSGRCFHSVAMASTPTTADYVPVKPFTNPLKDGSKETNTSRDLQICKPRHDPSAPNSIVMPRPSKHHQQMFNKSGNPVVDVVLDPYVAVHLRPHQREGILFLYECVMGMRVSGQFGAILADEMGLGKTLQCISLIWTLLRQGPYGGKPILKKALIVTPGSLVKNWRKEFQKWLGTERMRVFAVDQDHKVEDFIASPLYSVLIISYEMLLRSLEQLQELSFDLIICDEGHRLKNSSIKTTSALSSLSCSRRIILSGTPVQNDLQEFYALIDFVNPGILGSLSTYRKIYEEPIIRSREPSANKEEKKLGDERAAELGRLTGLFVLRRTQEVINKFLPPKIESIVFCKPSAFQLDLYRKLLSSRLVRCCLQGSGESSPHLVCIGALKKLCNHPRLLYKTIQEKSTNVNGEEQSFYESLAELFPPVYSTNTVSVSESGKLSVLTKLLFAIREQSPSERVVLVSHYTQTLNILQDLCRQHGYKCTRLDGQTPVTHRQQIVDGFNSKYSADFIFLLSSKAGGVGLNLIGACHLILYDIDWNPANDIQAMARVWRDGQTRTVHIYRLLTTGTIEEKIYQRQISKQGLSGAVVDLAKKSEHIRFSVDELRDLFTLHEDSDCVTHELLECDCTQTKSLTDDTTENHFKPRGSHQGKKAEKNISMSELMQWKHFSMLQDSDDPFLRPGREYMSFVFQNMTNS